MRARTAKGGRYASCVLLLLLLLGGVGRPAPPGVPQGPHAQPALLALAAAEPAQQFAVIIQKATQDANVAALVSRWGGRITKDLHIINAVSAELSGQAVTALAGAPGVRWVSLDAPVQHAAADTARFTTWASNFAGAAPSLISGSFNGAAIPANGYIWFNAVVSVTGLGAAPAHLLLTDASVRFRSGNADYNLPVPNALITFNPAAPSASTTFIPEYNVWYTVVNSSMSGNTWLTGLSFKVPAALPGGITPLTWAASFTTDTPTVNATWKWAAATYSSFNNDYTSLSVKPCDSSLTCGYPNNDPAGTPEAYKAALTAGATGSGGTNYTGGYTPEQAVHPAQQFYMALAMIDSPGGPNGTYGFGSRLTAGFSGFTGEKTDGKAITRVEVALRTFVLAPLGSGDMLRVSVAGNGRTGTPVAVPSSVFNGHLGLSQAGTVYVDVTASRAWQWGDFTNDIDPLHVTLDQTAFDPYHVVFYDAVGLRVTSGTGTDATGGGTARLQEVNGPRDSSKLSNVFNQVTGATRVWNEGPAYRQGGGLSVAVVDSGMLYSDDTAGRIVASENFNAAYHTAGDTYGHGTFVGDIVAGDGTLSQGAYQGVAPQTDLVNVRVSDDQGAAAESDVVAGLEWVHDNAAQYNIKVVNLSLNTGIAQSYNTDPLDAAVEILWFDGIVVVVSAGNNGGSTLYPPANDPFVITVGATDDHGTVTLADDTLASFSAYGTDESGGVKPDLVAPGTNIVALLPGNGSLTLAHAHPAKEVNANYFRMSGTSVAAPMVAGAVALMLQGEPGLTPDQVKYRLKATANPGWPGYNPARAGAGYLDIYAAVHGTTSQSANTGINASQLLWTGGEPITWGSVSWNSVSWNSVSWNSVSWNSVSWNSVSWNSDYWGP